MLVFYIIGMVISYLIMITWCVIYCSIEDRTRNDTEVACLAAIVTPLFWPLTMGALLLFVIPYKKLSDWVKLHSDAIKEWDEKSGLNLFN